jgi:hypothetical protein
MKISYDHYELRRLLGVQEYNERGVVRIPKETVMICWKQYSDYLTLKLKQTAKTIIHRSSLYCSFANRNVKC